ncbi:hypothetical protein F5890DRAFT_491094 [Lentinula detonsa]|uniref:Uncharacterized protein n=1 Tax=Lentinula detonsa TaxID=2804962 RepID=A0AA38UQ16_9AGAR|nr:hypothetical protein F5890DRAFT_491094 [Lentinula detonsa]
MKIRFSLFYVTILGSASAFARPLPLIESELMGPVQRALSIQTPARSTSEDKEDPPLADAITHKIFEEGQIY